jgi:hypothetical protein
VKQDYGARIYDQRVARFLSVDPLTGKYPWYTPYQFAGNKAIWAVDLDGLEEYYSINAQYLGKIGDSKEIRVITHNDILDQVKSDLSCAKCNHEWLNEKWHSQKAYISSDNAAIDWGFDYQGKTHLHNWEYFSSIGMKEGKDKNSKSITLYILGTEWTNEEKHASDIDKSPLLEGWTKIAGIHSHPYEKGWDFENFSPYRDETGFYGDIYIAESNNINFYLTTPKGYLKKYTIGDKRISTITDELPYDNNNFIFNNSNKKPSMEHVGEKKNSKNEMEWINKVINYTKHDQVHINKN